VSLYRRELEGAGLSQPAVLSVLRERAMERDADRFAREWRERHSMRVTCSTCGRSESLLMFPLEYVRSQIRLWRDGWRRDPPTQLDYCPDCV
jgi:hypothetical protein